MARFRLLTEVSHVQRRVEGYHPSFAGGAPAANGSGPPGYHTGDGAGISKNLFLASTMKVPQLILHHKSIFEFHMHRMQIAQYG